ncbi:MAG: hypothetical protein OXG37_15515 [Actinomycetia bacterium]|nr:hypothetical protein [Actinomycetes bacterium]
MCRYFEEAGEAYFGSLETEDAKLIYQAGAKLGKGANRLLEAEHAFDDAVEGRTDE